VIGLTQRQAELLAFIQQYQAEHGGVSPSFDEMMASTGGTSKSRIFHLLRLLEEKGRIRRLRHKSRAIEVVRENRLSAFTDRELVAELDRRALAGRLAA